MYEKIVRILDEKYGIEDVKPESKIKTDLGLNSFELMELSFTLEEMFHIELKDSFLRDVETIQDICDYLEKTGAGNEY